MNRLITQLRLTWKLLFLFLWFFVPTSLDARDGPELIAKILTVQSGNFLNLSNNSTQPMTELCIVELENNDTLLKGTVLLSSQNLGVRTNHNTAGIIHVSYVINGTKSNFFVSKESNRESFFGLNKIVLLPLVSLILGSFLTHLLILSRERRKYRFEWAKLMLDRARDKILSLHNVCRQGESSYVIEKAIEDLEQNWTLPPKISNCFDAWKNEKDEKRKAKKLKAIQKMLFKLINRPPA